MRTGILLLFLLVFFCRGSQLHAQSAPASIDSLIRLSGQWRLTNLDSARLLALQAHTLADMGGYIRLRGKAAYQLGVCLEDIGLPDSSLGYLHLALNDFSQDGWDFGQILALNVIGAAYRSKGDARRALQFLQASHDKALESADSISMAYALDNMGNVYWDGEERAQAKAYYLRALHIARNQQQEDPYLLNTVLNNISLVTEGPERYQYLLEASQAARQSADSSSLVYIWNNLGNYHAALLEGADSSRYYFQRSLEAALALGDQYSALAAMNGLSSYYLARNALSEAGQWTEQALQLSRKLDSPEQLAAALANSSMLLRRKGQFEQALLLQDSLLLLNSQLFSEDKAQALGQAYQRFSVADKDRELLEKDLALTRQQNQAQRLFAALALLALLLLSITLWWRYRLVKTRQAHLAQEQELHHWQALHELKSRLFADVSHDLRHPLSLIMGPVLELKESIRNKEQVRLLDIAARSSQTLLSRVNDLLDLARLEAGQLQPNYRAEAYHTFFQRVVQAHESAARERELYVELDYKGPNPCPLLIDADKLEKILQNLLSNALKYSPQGGVIHCESDYHNGMLHIRVRDQGPGISPQQEQHLFERFQSGPHSREGGIGIGLSICKALAECMGGTLQLLRLPSQTGTCFELQIPAEVVDIQRAGTDTEQPRTTAALRPAPLPDVRVLVVEDQADMREYLRLLLLDYFFVFTAANGREALRLLQTETVHLVVSDVMMPEMDGMALRRAILETPRFRHLPFVFLTATLLDENQFEALRLGVDDLLLKPFRPQELLIRLQNLWQNSQLRQRALQENLEEAGSAQELRYRQLHRLALEHLGDSVFNVQAWADRAGISSRQLSRILQAETGMSPVQYLLELRLQKAYRLMSERRFFTVSEVAYACGLESLSYFSRKFQERFGVKASQLLWQREGPERSA